MSATVRIRVPVELPGVALARLITVLDHTVGTTRLRHTGYADFELELDLDQQVLDLLAADAQASRRSDAATQPSPAPMPPTAPVEGPTPAPAAVTAPGLAATGNGGRPATEWHLQRVTVQPHDSPAPVPSAQEQRQRGGRPGRDPEQIAEIVRQAWANGENPYEAVRRELRCTYSAAKQTVYRAERKLGVDLRTRPEPPAPATVDAVVEPDAEVVYLVDEDLLRASLALVPEGAPYDAAVRQLAEAMNVPTHVVEAALAVYGTYVPAEPEPVRHLTVVPEAVEPVAGRATLTVYDDCGDELVVVSRGHGQYVPAPPVDDGRIPSFRHVPVIGIDPTSRRDRETQLRSVAARGLDGDL